MIMKGEVRGFQRTWLAWAGVGLVIRSVLILIPSRH